MADKWPRLPQPNIWAAWESSMHPTTGSGGRPPGEHGVLLPCYLARGRVELWRPDVLKRPALLFERFPLGTDRDGVDDGGEIHGSEGVNKTWPCELIKWYSVDILATLVSNQVACRKCLPFPRVEFFSRANPGRSSSSQRWASTGGEIRRGSKNKRSQIIRVQLGRREKLGPRM